MSIVTLDEKKEKNIVALGSVVGAIVLTITKLTVGLLTGSLGILSEAMHSGLDLVAAMMTFFAVRFADRPPDADHQFGHGKIENLSALFETLLLLITCIWIVYEAVERLTTSRTLIEVNFWSFAVIGLSIAIDFTRSRALLKAAKKYKNQALEADAIHFSSDILSSAVVIIGLIFSSFGLHFMDSVSALVVAVVVVGICFRLGKRAIDDLLDKSPTSISEQIALIAADIPEILRIHDIKTRTSGSFYQAEMSIHVQPELTIEQAHEISHNLEKLIQSRIARCNVHVHAEPHRAEISES
jgi:cation diffusion facilitator family transporter